MSLQWFGDYAINQFLFAKINFQILKYLAKVLLNTPFPLPHNLIFHLSDFEIYFVDFNNFCLKKVINIK